MEKKLTVDDARKVELGILKYIDSVCRSNNIPYCLDYGTLLGAIRHKGFIPWDDDIDISMKRDDYERFVELMQSNTPSQYRLLTDKTCEGYYYEYGKMVDTSTRLVETDIMEIPEMGVWVDIFPKDNISLHHSFYRTVLLVSISMRILAVYERFPKHYSWYFYPIWIIARLIGYRFFLKLTRFWQRASHRDSNVGYIGDLSDRTSLRHKWPKDMFDSFELVDFDGDKYPAPQNWDEYLKGLYNDYMTLPPVEERRVHRFDAFWR